MTALPESAQFHVLGPLEVRGGGEPIAIASGRERALLAVLLLRANRLVTVDELVEAVWGEQPPDNPRATVQTVVMRLRKKLPGGSAVIQTYPGGYLATPPYLDLDAFRGHVAAAAKAAQDGELNREAVELRAGLALWRGPVLANVPSEALHRDVVPALMEERLAAVHQRIEVDLDLGHAGGLVAELRTLTAEHPLREGLWALLMRALHAAGRQAEALEVFETIRRRLADELGIDPGTELRGLHQTILTSGDLLPAGSTGRLIPRQLPPDVRAFTGRAGELERLDALLDAHRSGNAEAVVITAVAGTAGVGKTALTIHFGHQVAGQFPDGQLYIDLRGYAPTAPMAPAEALERLLRGLGTDPEHIPTDETELAAAYRSTLSGRRVLVVLDNARSADQVEPLLPGYPGCLVLITSRGTLALDGAVHMQLDVLPEQEAVRLLARMAGADRVTGEPEAAVRLVNLCARLPLAVRIAGARLATRPGWSVETLVRRLADTQHRLDELRVADRAVRASFAVSHQALLTSDNPVDRAAAQAFRLLGAVDWGDLSVPVAAALFDVPQAEAHTVLERLVDDHLIDSNLPGRYQTHDLLRLFARDLVHDGETALQRTLDCYIAAAEQATKLLNPNANRHIPDQPTPSPRGGFTLSTAAEATAWVETELPNVMAIVQQAAIAPRDTQERVLRLSTAVEPALTTRRRMRELISLRLLGAGLARDFGARPAEALANEDVGWAYATLGRTDEAITATKRALDLWRATGDRSGEQRCLHHLGAAYWQQEAFEEAVDSLEQALTISREIDYRRGESATLDVLGLLHQRLGRFEKAIEYHQQGLNIDREIGDRHGEAAALCNLGWAHHRAGKPHQAMTYQQQSVGIARELNNRYIEAEALWGLGQSYHAVGDDNQARTHWHGSIGILNDLGEIRDEEAEILLHQAIPETPAVIQNNV